MNTEEEIKKLKEKVTELEDKVKWLVEEAGHFREWADRVSGAGGGGGGAAEETTSDDLYEVVSFDVKKRPADIVGDHWMGQPYAWKLTVKNTSPKKISLHGSVVFQDSDDFEIEREGISSFEVKANSTHSETGIAVIGDKNKVGKVKEITCQFDAY
jgi:hypothetical protein